MAREGLRKRVAAAMRDAARIGLLLLALCVAFHGTVSAQQDQQEQAETPVLPDSGFAGAPISSGGAFLRSLVVPGWAQAELGAQSRGALYFFAWSFSLFMVARTQIRLNHAERNEAADPGLVDARKQQREDWLALVVFTAFFSAADGWISVHLYGFDEKTGLSPEGAVLQVGWKIPFGP